MTFPFLGPFLVEEITIYLLSDIKVEQESSGEDCHWHAQSEFDVLRLMPEHSHTQIGSDGTPKKSTPKEDAFWNAILPLDGLLLIGIHEKQCDQVDHDEVNGNYFIHKYLLNLVLDMISYN